MDELEERRRRIREKIKRRSSPELFGIVLVALIFAFLLFTSLPGEEKAEQAPAQTQEKAVEQERVQQTPSLSPETSPSVVSPISMPAPSIKIYSPKNTTYNTSTPLLSFIVAGSNLDTVLLSVDGGENITLPHDGTIAKIDFAKGYPLFIEDFSGRAKRWSGSGFKVTNGEYVSSKGDVVAGNENWDDYCVEAKVNIKSGKNVAYLGLRWKDGIFYGIHTFSGRINEIKLVKSPPYTLLISAQTNIKRNKWHTWKICAEKNNIRAYIDGIKYIEYIDNVNPNLQGKIRIIAENTLAHFDDIVVYKPLSNGLHSLTIFANNTAGNASSATVFFAVNTTSVEEIKDKDAGMRETLRKEGFEVTLKYFEIRKEVKVYPNALKQEQYAEIKTQSVLTLQVKNIEETEKPFKLEPTAVMVDDLGNQYQMRVYKYTDVSNQIEQVTIYPGVTREGVILFDPVSLEAKKLTLYLYINGIKYTFVFNPFSS